MAYCVKRYLGSLVEVRIYPHQFTEPSVRGKGIRDYYMRKSPAVVRRDTQNPKTPTFLRKSLFKTALLGHLEIEGGMSTQHEHLNLQPKN